SCGRPWTASRGTRNGCWTDCCLRGRRRLRWSPRTRAPREEARATTKTAAAAAAAAADQAARPKNGGKANAALSARAARANAGGVERKTDTVISTGETKTPTPG
ncbi:unnamed protein product, partial [Ectocarpus sp. 8 AP-2014]